jgi:FkbM family methyltransferase
VSVIGRLVHKMNQSRDFFRQSRTPFRLALDSFKLNWSPFIAQSKDGLKLRLDPRCGDSFTFYENLIRRDYLRHGVQLRPGDTVVDIGANIGAFSVLAASIVGPQGRVIAFEPGSRTFDRLKANIEINQLRNVTLVRCAIGGADGEAQLDVGTRSAYNSIRTDLCENNRVTGLHETVRVRPLADALADAGVEGEIGLLKMDCEGSEYDIFDSFPADLASRIRQVSMEVHEVSGRQTSEIDNRLRDLNFDVRAAFPLTAFRR